MILRFHMGHHSIIHSNLFCNGQFRISYIIARFSYCWRISLYNWSSWNNEFNKFWIYMAQIVPDAWIIYIYKIVIIIKEVILEQTAFLQRNMQGLERNFVMFSWLQRSAIFYLKFSTFFLKWGLLISNTLLINVLPDDM